VRPGSRTKVSLPLVLPQNRHPACPGLPWERSASQIDRLTEGFLRGVEEPVLSEVEGTSAELILPMLLGAFHPPKPGRPIKLRSSPILRDGRSGLVLMTAVALLCACAEAALRK
jgi:hypothetical protein